VHHCAVVIQSRLRGYFQRRKYKAFLPIYRRVRELLSAVAAGWKLRRILRLQPVKAQIGEIRVRIRNGQVSAARIAKREFADEIERLGKKGRWIEVLLRSRMMKSKSNLDGKENSSLYGNIKSKSIKNVFKEQPRVESDKPKPRK
jgi:myosin heavy subunit